MDDKPEVGGRRYWDTEVLRYARPHPRLHLVARILTELKVQRVLDVGCAGGALRTLLAGGIDYFGCDLTEEASEVLPAGRFLQVDLNCTTDLSYFAELGLDAVSVGGVLEYLRRPADLLVELRKLVGDRGTLVVSIINFSGTKYQSPGARHPGWVFTPSLRDLLEMLHESGWEPVRVRAAGSRSSIDRLVLWMRTRIYGPSHKRVHSHAEQFLVVARASRVTSAPPTTGG